MECREVRSLAEAYVSEQLLVETTQAVVGHLERCPTCRAEMDGLRRLRAATRAAVQQAPDLSVRPEFVVALTAELRARAARRRGPATPRRVWLPIAASILLIVAAGWGWREFSPSSLSALLHAAVGDHRFCALTFKLTERPIPLDEAARRYGGVNGLLATVEPATTTLSGGALKILERHSCLYDGRRFAHLVLGYKNEKVSLLVTDDARRNGAPADATPSDLPVTDGFHVATFRGTNHVVFVVSSLTPDDVQEVAQAMAAPVTRILSGAARNIPAGAGD